MDRIMRVALTLLLALFAGGGLAACGDDGGGNGDEEADETEEPSEDAEDEDRIDGSGLEAQFVDFLQIDSAECPDDFAREEGETFECELTSAGQTDVVTVTVTLSGQANQCTIDEAIAFESPGITGCFALSEIE
jgi:hypothetical protein